MGGKVNSSKCCHIKIEIFLPYEATILNWSKVLEVTHLRSPQLSWTVTPYFKGRRTS